MNDTNHIKFKMETIDKIEKTVNTINRKVNELENSVIKLDMRVTDIENSCKFMSDIADENKREIDNTKTHLDALRKNCGRQSTKS